MIFAKTPELNCPLRLALFNAYRMPEDDCVNHLLANVNISNSVQEKIQQRAANLVGAVRETKKGKSGVEAFLHQYHLSSQEGIALMCVAEALLRIPDAATVRKLIRDKIGRADWKNHLGQSDSLFVNAATFGLMLTGKILSPKDKDSSGFSNALQKLVERGGDPFIRRAVMQAMRILGKQFVMGRNIQEACKRAIPFEERGYRYSYDMLGEAARTKTDAEKYFKAYVDAIAAVAKQAPHQNVVENPGISVKLSALYPRYEYAKHDEVLKYLTPKLLTLAQKAKEANISLFVDAEEADRLDLSLDVIEKVFSDESLKSWEGFGLALQSYQKRAWYLIDWLVELAQKNQKKLFVRLIKGAYWDSEIKWAQERGLSSYPVFTRKSSTDLSFIACAQKILKHPDAIYPAFATHNAHSVATILELAGNNKNFEFQCLHGMGDTLYDQIVGIEKLNHPCRVYAPVGTHEDLLPYLVRRLLENGANSSFVNRIVDENTKIDDLIANPVDVMQQHKIKSHPKIPLPSDIFSPERKNSQGLDMTNTPELIQLAKDMESALQKQWHARPTIQNNKQAATDGIAIKNPSDKNKIIGFVTEATQEEVEASIAKAAFAADCFAAMAVTKRAELLNKAADLLEKNRPALLALAVAEAGKTLSDAVAEVREAVDFCRYYAALALEVFKPKKMPGPTGEENYLTLHGRGPVVCISPWNFPLAIFVGQMAAALACGCPVLAKPAEQTPLMAAFAVSLFHQAGFSEEQLQLLPGRGETVGAKLVADVRTQGVVFTGSTEVAKLINQTLANRTGAIIPLIAETGGQNAMIVDSSALPEQVVMDVIASSFNSAGQRCSALRVLFLQEEISDKVINMLKGAMAELTIADPALLTTDVGPVIDEEALQRLRDHAERMDKQAKLIAQVAMDENLIEKGTFFAPRAYELSGLNQLTQEVFGPVLHVIRFKSDDLNKVVESINQTGYGLTLGIHSRIQETIDFIRARAHVGNCYVNRNIIGAVVGVQPFGGEGLSGTGPKAGGPNYLTRFCHERCVSINTTASGGNASLICLDEG